MLKVLVLAASLLLAGCTPSAVIAYRAMSDQEPTGDTLRQLQQESLPYRKKGAGVVTGQVFLTTANGQLVPPADTQVLVAPATEYSIVRFNKFVVEDNEFPPAIRAAVVWHVRTDAQGRFQLQQLPAGSYLVGSEVFWTPPGRSARAEIPYARFDLPAGGTAEIAVTRTVD